MSAPVTAVAPLTAKDIDQIIEVITEFVMNGKPAIDAMWQPYIDQLRAQRAQIVAAPELLDALKALHRNVDKDLSGFWTESTSNFMQQVEAAIAKAEGRS